MPSLRSLAAALSLCSLVTACPGDEETAPVRDAEPTGCDAAPLWNCACQEPDEICVVHSSERGWNSCSSYERCAPNPLGCAPGACTPECEAALCESTAYHCATGDPTTFQCLRP